MLDTYKSNLQKEYNFELELLLYISAYRTAQRQDIHNLGPWYFDDIFRLSKFPT